MIEIDDSKSDTEYRLILSPNCSISWRQLMAFYLMTCAVAIVIAVFFTLQGQWLILPFSGLEMLVLGLALNITSRKVHRREVITVEEHSVKIEKGVREVEQNWEFERCWIKFRDEPEGDRKTTRKLTIGSHGEYVEVGNFLSNFEKDALAFQLKGCIIPT